MRKSLKTKPKLKNSDGKNLAKIYYDSSHPAGFASLKKLQKATSIPLPVVREWSTYQDTITKYKRTRKKFPRNKIKVSSINEQWQVDLCDMRKYEAVNNGYTWIFTKIDCFSRVGAAIALKSKSASEIIRALTILFKVEKPLKLQSDRGTEFTNARVQKFLDDNNVLFFTADNPDTKCAMVERFNKSLKEPMWKKFDYEDNTVWYLDLPKFVKRYNNSVHSSIKMTPSNVNKLNMLEVYKTLYGSEKKGPIKFKYQVGDQVRIKKEKLTFEKGYEANFSIELFTISQRKGQSHPVYKVKDLNGVELTSIFYEPELVKVSKLDNRRKFKIEKVLERKGNEIKVKWEGYPDSFNQWIPKKKGL